MRPLTLTSLLTLFSSSFVGIVGVGLAVPSVVHAQSAPMVIGIGADGTTTLAQAPVDLVSLRTLVTALSAQTNPPSWKIQADPAAPPARMIEVIEVLNTAGVSNYAIDVGTVASGGGKVVQAPAAPAPPAAPSDAAPSRVEQAAPTPQDPGPRTLAPTPPTPPTPPAPPAPSQSKAPPPTLAPDAPKVAPPPIPVREPSRATRDVQLTGDYRFNLDGTDVGTDDPGLDFKVYRFAPGVKARLSPRIKARATVNVYQSDAVIEEPFTTDAGDTGSVTIDSSDNGWHVRARDMWVEWDATGKDDVFVQAGVQPHIFGERDFVASPKRGTYVLGGGDGPVAERAGIVAGSRVLGVTARAQLAQDKAEIALQASNGTGNSTGGDENSGKDGTLRLRYQATDSLEIVAAGLYGVENPDNSGITVAYNAGFNLDADWLRFTGNYLGGSLDSGAQGSTAVPFVGVDGAVWVGTDVAPEQLETLALATKLSYFDPVAQEQDAGAIMVVDAVGQLWFATDVPHGVMVALGYRNTTPMNAELPIDHQLRMQALWVY